MIPQIIIKFFFTFFSAKYIIESKVKTPLGETGCLGNQYFLLTGWLGIQFLVNPYVNKVSLASFGYLPLTVQHLCDLQDAMPCHWSPSASHPVHT